MDSTVALNGLGRDAAVCTNEYGVVMTMSITAFSNAQALAADPLLPDGLTEFTASELVVCQSRTAREAVKVLTDLLDTYGSSEVNIAFIADQKEVWYVEMYTGHQYAAVLLPPDAVCVFGNEFLMEYVSDYADSILSPDLESLPETAGFAVRGKNGELNLWATYSGASIVTDYSHLRTWAGHHILAPDTIGAYSREARCPLCFTPAAPVSLTDVMALIRNRFEGTEFSPDETGQTDMRVIGTDTALSVHVAQVYPTLPRETSCVIWESSGPAVYGVFVPVSNAALQVCEAYGRNQPREEAMRFDHSYPYYRFKELNTLCVEPNASRLYGKAVREYWHEAEQGMTAGLASVLETAAAMEDSQAAARYITDYCCSMQNQAFDDAGELLNRVR